MKTSNSFHVTCNTKQYEKTYGNKLQNINVVFCCLDIDAALNLI